MPTRISIMGIPFEVKYLTKVDHQDNHLGETDGAGRVIKIKKGMAEEVTKATLMHEIVHAIIYVTGHTEMLKHKHEEAIVLAIEHGLSQLYELKK